MINYILGGVIVVIIGLAIRYMVKVKQSGGKCIGCPHGNQCSGHCGGSCSIDIE